MKQTFYFALFTLIFLCSTSCKKETLEISTTTLPPTTIKTEACFSSDCMTLILAHPSDNFFYEDPDAYKIEWLKNEVFFKTGHRLSCTHSGNYKAIITFLDSKQVRELTYELDLELSE